MRIRHYTPADLDALRCLHAAQGFGYPFPDLESPLFISKLVLEDNDNRTPEVDGESVGRELGSTDSQAESRGAESSYQTSRTSTNSPNIVMAVLFRLTAEAYLLHDASAGTPRQRWQNLLALHEAARRDAAARGLDDVQAFLPPRIARAFGRRLARLGWRQDPWPCFSKRLP
jgi:hypothetical protein